MARERWRNVPGWARYRVSSNGRVNGPRGLLRPIPDRDGYLYVTLRAGQLRPRRVHVAVLVLEAFSKPRPQDAEACHGPGGRQDNRTVNLRWGTHRENERDKKRESWIGTEETVSRPELPVFPVTSGQA